MPKIDSYKIDNYKIDGAIGSNVKGVQRGEYTVLVGDPTTINISISPVDLTKSIPKIYVSGTGGNAAYDAFRCTLTSPTNLQITRNTSGNTGTTLSWEVIEYNNVKSLQSGLLTLNTTPQNLTISSVNMSKTDIFVTSTNPSAGGGTPYMNVNASLTTSTNIKFISIGPATYNYIVQWHALEFL